MRVDRLQQAFAIDVAIRHFPLHPETPEAGQTLEELFAGRNVDIATAQIRMARLMAEEGLPYGERSMTYNSRLAQELAVWAVSSPGGERIHGALFHAYFVDNVNLGDITDLTAIAAGIGLSETEAREILQKRTYRDVVDDDWRRSRELGITGVPTFVIGNHGLVGAQPYEQLAEFVASAGAQLRAT